MNRLAAWIAVWCGIVIVSVTCASAASKARANLNLVKLPEGFRIEVYADNVPEARSMALGDNGTLFVGTRSEGAVYAVVDRDKNNRADRVITVATRLNSPNGVAFRGGCARGWLVPFF